MDYTKKPFNLTESDLTWVEQTFASMTQEEKLNQVFVDMLWNNPPKEVEAQQTAYQLGGYRYNNAGPDKLYEQNAAIQLEENQRIKDLVQPRWKWDMCLQPFVFMIN